MVSSALLALLIYLSMWIGWVQDWAWLGAVDDRFLAWGRALTAADPALVSAWDWFCTLLGPAAFRIIGVGIIIWLLIRRNWRTALFLLATIELSGPLIEVAKRVADRPRPDGQMVYAYGTAFPSGHALGVMVSVLAFLTVAWAAAAGGARRRRRHRDRRRTRGAQRPSSVRRAGRLGAGLRLLRRVPAIVVDQGRKTGRIRYSAVKLTLWYSASTSPSRATGVGPSTAVKLNSGA